MSTSQQRKRFMIPSFPPSKILQKVPKIAEVTIEFSKSLSKENANILHLEAPSRALANRLGNPKLLIGFDIETHSWLENETNKGRIGKFGWYTLKEERLINFARIVQLGWAVGRVEIDAPVRVVNNIIRPTGFEISDKAAKFHGISQARAIREGRCLEDTLRAFMADVQEVCRCGGRVVAHHLEFDAGIILNELNRCGLHDLHAAWLQFAQQGFCTMDFEVGRWVLACRNQETGPESVKHCLALKTIVRHVIQEHNEMFRQHSDACVGAQCTRLVYATILQWAESAMQNHSLHKKEHTPAELQMPHSTSNEDENDGENS
eukprot:12407422-Karenia_brevis.AAC.1